jgi:hypothetical protein
MTTTIAHLETILEEHAHNPANGSPTEENYDFEKLSDAEEWAYRTSLVFDTDEECQEECERLLKTVTVRERDE